MKKYFFYLTIVFTVVFYYNTSAQVFSFKVDGKFFTGKVTDAVVVNFLEAEYVQIRAESEDKILYLYCKLTSLKGELPITLEFTEPNPEKGESPASEVVWVPDGPDNPQWNGVEGETVVTQHDAENKTISGTFEFVVEKFQYSSKAGKKRPSAEITNGIFSNIKYRLEENKEG